MFFHSSVTLSFVAYNIKWAYELGIIRHASTATDLVKLVGPCDLYFLVH